MFAPCKNSFCTREAAENHSMCKTCQTVAQHAQQSASVQAESTRIEQRKNNSSLAAIYPKYYKHIPEGVTDADTYVINMMFPIDSRDDPTGTVLHARKKLLIPGTRSGGKSFYDDIREARDTLTRYLELMGPQQGKRAEDAGQVPGGVAKVPAGQPKTFEAAPTMGQGQLVGAHTLVDNDGVIHNNKSYSA